jgi:site-specific DNA-methyltransferase (adenine-specific)
MDPLVWIAGLPGGGRRVWLDPAGLMGLAWFWQAFFDAGCLSLFFSIIWDRSVGYNERYDSFTPQYEMILVLRQAANAKPYFDKDAVRLPYDEDKIQSYLRDKRYRDKDARERHLRKGKYATNILRVPSLKGSSKEKIGHPSQKPITLINQLISASTRKGDYVLDPFLGSGTTAAAAQELGRRWVGIESNPEYVRIAQKRITDILAVPEFSLD